MIRPTVLRTSRDSKDAIEQAPLPPFPARSPLSFLLAHVALGALVFAWPILATVHAWATVGVGFWVATSARRATSIATMAAYFVGAEVLWRMARAATFWEMGKYAVIAVLLVSFARWPPRRSLLAPLAFFTLLLPSVWVSVQSLTLSEARSQVSFNLSGPLALAVCACFFKQLTVSRQELGHVLLGMIGPVLTIGTLTLLSTYTASELIFSARSSNFVTSAGFGPNQVSAVLGLAAVFCFLLLAVQPALGGLHRALLFGVLVVCSVQSAMTFSRGGLYMTGAAMAAAAWYFLRDRVARTRVAAGGVVLILLGYGLILPALSNLTEGIIVERFEQVTTTGRVERMQVDLQLWADAPLFGVGPGMGPRVRPEASFVAAHTEWSRMLAEHGVFGLAALVLLVGMMISNLRHASGPIARGIVLALLTWYVSFQAVDGMRIAAPAFIFGLTFVTLQDSGGFLPLAGALNQRLGGPRTRPHVSGAMAPSHRLTRSAGGLG